MSKTYFTIAEQKTNIINFIKKHKDILGVTEKVKDITDEYLDELKNASTEEFFRLAHKVKLKFGQNYYIFADNYNEKHHMIVIWLPEVLNEVVDNNASKIDSDKAIEDFCGYNSFDDVIETHSFWYNMTPKRWEMFEAVFDFYDNTSLQTG